MLDIKFAFIHLCLKKALRDISDVLTRSNTFSSPNGINPFVQANYTEAQGEV